MEETAAASREKTFADLKTLVADTDDLLRATAGQAGEKISTVRARTEDAPCVGLVVSSIRKGSSGLCCPEISILFVVIRF